MVWVANDYNDGGSADKPAIYCFNFAAIFCHGKTAAVHSPLMASRIADASIVAGGITAGFAAFAWLH